MVSLSYQNISKLKCTFYTTKRFKKNNDIKVQQNIRPIVTYLSCKTFLLHYC